MLNTRLANPIGKFAEEIFFTIDLESKIYSYNLLSFFRFNLPAIDCFILELKLGVNLESSEILATIPATLVYVFANIQNFSIKNLLSSNKDQNSSQSSTLPKATEEQMDEEPKEFSPSKGHFKDYQKLSYDMLRRKSLFTFICYIMTKDVSVDTKALYDRIMTMDSRLP
jgi:hypothetical protein